MNMSSNLLLAQIFNYFVPGPQYQGSIRPRGSQRVKSTALTGLILFSVSVYGLST